MKVLSVPIGILTASAVLTAFTAGFFPGILDLPILFFMIFGMLNTCCIMLENEKAEQCRSLVFRFNPVVSFFLSIGNPVSVLSAFFVLFLSPIGAHTLAVSLQPPVLGFALMVGALSLLWYTSVSKLTPKPGTMVVDNDLYYLPEEILPRLSSYAMFITEKTEIPVSVQVSSGGVLTTVSTLFHFAPWVFEADARPRLPGHMYYSQLLKKAEREFAAMLQNRTQTGGDAEASPYIFQHAEK